MAVQRNDRFEQLEQDIQIGRVIIVSGVLKKTGERQVASNIDDIRSDHKNRYFWARDKLAKTDIVIDAGCGVGYGSKILAENCESVFAYDISKSSIEFANRYWRNPNILFCQSDLHFAEFKPSTTDKIVAFEVIEHLAVPELFIRRAYNALKSNGIMFISVPNSEEIPHSITLNPFHFRHYLFEEIIVLFETCGFELKSHAFQDDDEIFDGGHGKFILIEFQKIESAHLSNKEFDLESLFKSLVNEVHSRAEAIAYLKKELESKSEQSEKRAGFIRDLRKECEEKTLDVEIIAAKLSSYEKASNNFSNILETQMRGVIENLHRELEDRNSEVLQLTSKLAKYKTICEQLSKEKSDTADLKLFELQARNEVLNATLSFQKKDYEQKLLLESSKNCKLEETVNFKSAEFASKLKHESQRNELLMKQLEDQRYSHQEALADLRLENDRLVRVLETGQSQLEAKLNEMIRNEDALKTDLARKSDEYVKDLKAVYNRVYELEKERDDIIGETVSAIDELKLEAKLYKQELALEREKNHEIKELLENAEAEIQNLRFVNEYYQNEVENNSALVEEKNRRIKCRGKASKAI